MTPTRAVELLHSLVELNQLAPSENDQRAAAELSAVMESMPDAVYIGSLDGIYLANGAALDQLGFTSFDELRRNIAVLAHELHTRDAATGAVIPGSEQAFARALRGEKVTQDVIVQHRVTGEDRVVRCAAAPVIVGGQVVAAVAVNTDVTDVRRVASAHAALESRIAERTSELATLNARLTGEIAERIRADEDRNLLSRQLASAEEGERRRIARELHDQLGQHMTALTLGLDEVAKALPAGGPVRERLATLQDLTVRMTADARHLALELRPPELDDVGIESALETYVAQWSERYGIPADFEIASRGGLGLEAEAATTFYRVVQEGLTNVVKHAHARSVSVLVEKRDGEVRLIIEDDGDGFELDATLRRASVDRRLGLAGMRERARLVGGALIVESARGIGTTLYLRLPEVAHTAGRRPPAA